MTLSKQPQEAKDAAVRGGLRTWEAQNLKKEYRDQRMYRTLALRAKFPRNSIAYPSFPLWQKGQSDARRELFNTRRIW